MKKLIIIAILGVLTSITPFTLKADYTSINQPVSELSSYTLSEVITDITTPLSQYIITQDTAFDILDHPFIDLNNHTLTEVFESTIASLENLVTNGDFNNTSNLTNYYSGTQYNVSAGNLTIIGLNTHNTIAVSMNYNQINNNVYYMKTRARILQSDIASFRLVTLTPTNSTIITSPILNQWYDLNISFIASSSDNRPVVFMVVDDFNINGNILEVDYVLVFNLTASHGVTATSGTAYDNAVAEIEWILSKNDGFIESVGNPFEIVDLTVEQMDFWFNIYNGTTVLDGLEKLGCESYFFDDNVIYNIGEMVTDKIYSPLNNNTFDNLIEGTMQSQFNQWSTLDLETISTLSYQDYLFYDSDGTVADMLTWYNLYNTLVAQAEADALLIDDNELLTLIIALVLYIIGVVLALYLKNKMIFIGASLLWFIPIFTISNIFIILFSVIMIILSFVTAFFEKKTEDFD